MNIEKANKFRWRAKCAIFDFDWTLVTPKGNKTFPKDVDDWQWFRKSAPSTIKAWYDRGYAIVVMTNQSKAWKQDQIATVVNELDLPVLICIAFDKTLYKPNTSIFKQAMGDKKLDLKHSFFVGDALGRANDHSDCDFKFGEALNIKVYAPEDFFPASPKPIANPLSPKKTQEVVVMVGFPGSGKSTISKNVFENAQYFVAQGDALKTTKKMLKVSESHIQQGKSVVFDATNPTIEKRAEYIAFAKTHNLPIRCVHVNTSMEASLIRNNKREKPVPKIVYNVYKKKFQVPDKAEGFDDIVVL